MSQEVEFFFDFGSPYTYLAVTQLGRLTEKTGAEIKWKPFLLGAVFKGSGNQSPAAVRPKIMHLMVDLQRWVKLYGVSFKMPSAFPINTITALRMALAAAEKDSVARFSGRVFRAYWEENTDISKDEILVGLAADEGLDGEALLARTKDQEIKDQLKANTDDAIKRGAFGAPTFFVGKEMFWGNDRLTMLERHLLGK